LSTYICVDCGPSTRRLCASCTRIYVCMDCGRTGEATNLRGSPPKRCPICQSAHAKDRYERFAVAERKQRYERERQECTGRFVPCSSCGRSCPTGKGSRPAAERRCRSCGWTCARARKPAVEAVCKICGLSFVSAQRQLTCSAKCATAARVAALNGGAAGVCTGCGGATPPPKQFCEPCRDARRREHYRAKNYRRRTARRTLDVTQDYERELRVKAKRCPLCKVRLVSKPFLPASKELDHIIPINVGGTHTIGNVRIICRLCNMRRPDDGSDYTGPITLWAEDPTVVLRPRRAKRCCAQCAGSLTRGRCHACAPPQNHVPKPEQGRRAAQLRVAGMTWREIADATGLRGTGSAYLCATKYGEPEVIAAWPSGRIRAKGA
jgi:HNH endonuclease